MENFLESFQRNIDRSLELGIKEPVYRWGPVQITWRPELGTGQIDIIETKGMNFFDLKKFWDNVRHQLPEAEWELNPDKAIKDRIYSMLFKDDPQITRSGDAKMKALGREGFILKNKKNVDDIVDLSKFSRKGGAATREAKRQNLKQYRWKGKIYRLGRDGDRWVTEEYDEGRRFSETRASEGQPGSRLHSQVKKEQTRIADKNRFSKPTSAELDELAQMEIDARKHGKDLDHIYGQSYYSEESAGNRINSPKNRAELDPELNRGIKKAQEKGLSQHMLDMELRNPSKSMPLEQTLDFATDKPHYYEDVIHKSAIAGPASDLTAPVLNNTVVVRKAIDDPSIVKHLGHKNLYRGATLFGLPLVGFFGTGVKAATRVASAIPGEYATFGLWKGLDVAVANWSRQDYNEALRQYELNPTKERKEDLDFAARSLGFDTGSVFDPTPTSDVAGIANLFTHPGIKRALGFGDS